MADDDLKAIADSINDEWQRRQMKYLGSFTATYADHPTVAGIAAEEIAKLRAEVERLERERDRLKRMVDDEWWRLMRQRRALLRCGRMIRDLARKLDEERVGGDWKGAELAKACKRNEELREELADLNASTSLRHDADMRAIARWREAHPGRDLEMPDHADMVVWMMERLDEERAETAAWRAEAYDKGDCARRLKDRLRETAQILVECAGANGPCDAEDAARRTVSLVAKLERDLAGFKSSAEFWKGEYDRAIRDRNTAMGEREELERDLAAARERVGELERYVTVLEAVANAAHTVDVINGAGGSYKAMRAAIQAWIEYNRAALRPPAPAPAQDPKPGEAGMCACGHPRDEHWSNVRLRNGPCWHDAELPNGSCPCRRYEPAQPQPRGESKED